MSSILDMVRASLGDSAVKQISEKLGQDTAKTEDAVKTALPMIVGALAKSAQKGNADGLAQALERDHDGGILDNVSDFMRRGNFEQGSGILGHVMGDKAGAAAKALGSSTGIDSDKAGSLMAMLAPVVMGAMGKVKQEKGLDADSLKRVLSGEEREIDQQAPGIMGAIGGLLDADGDGDTDFSDLLAQGRRGLSRFF